MARRAVLLALLVACYLPLDPYAGEVHASLAVVVAASAADSVTVWEWQTLDTLTLLSGDSACVHFTAKASSPSRWALRTRYVSRDLVWWTPMRHWPHLTVATDGTTVRYDPGTTTC